MWILIDKANGVVVGSSQTRKELRNVKRSLTYFEGNKYRIEAV